MIRKVMVLAIACLIANRVGMASGALTCVRPGRGKTGSVRGRTVELKSGCRRRRSLGRYLGAKYLGAKYLGANTAAPPINMPGISATSNKAPPAAITPIVAAIVTKSCVGPDTGSDGRDPRLTSTLCFDTARPRLHGRCAWDRRNLWQPERKLM